VSFSFGICFIGGSFASQLSALRLFVIDFDELDVFTVWYQQAGGGTIFILLWSSSSSRELASSS